MAYLQWWGSSDVVVGRRLDAVQREKAWLSFEATGMGTGFFPSRTALKSSPPKVNFINWAPQSLVHSLSATQLHSHGQIPEGAEGNPQEGSRETARLRPQEHTEEATSNKSAYLCPQGVAGATHIVIQSPFT